MCKRVSVDPYTQARAEGCGLIYLFGWALMASGSNWYGRWLSSSEFDQQLRVSMRSKCTGIGDRDQQEVHKEFLRDSWLTRRHEEGWYETELPW